MPDIRYTLSISKSVDFITDDDCSVTIKTPKNTRQAVLEHNLQSIAIMVVEQLVASETEKEFLNAQEKILAN